jgi:LMBR1 domain-containing protein 1
LAGDARGEGQNWIMKAWFKIEVMLRPVRFLGGILLLIVSILIWVSMLLTSIDKAKNSVCKRHCGYILANINIFNPINWLFVRAAEVFPVDYIIFTVLVLLFFSSSVIGISMVGIRFLWFRIFQIRKGHTQPQALLIATVMLAMIILALNYSISMIVAPQYATYGPQTFCDRPPKHPGGQPDCTGHRNLIKPCSELVDNTAAGNVCTPTVASTFLNRITINFPFFGMVDFWAQFVFLGKSSRVPPLKNG